MSKSSANQNDWSLRPLRARQIQDWIENGRHLPNKLYASSMLKSQDRRSMVIIGVTLSLAWPKLPKSVPISEAIGGSPEALSVISAVLRIKAFLESRLLEDIELLEVKEGCVDISFAVPETVDDYIIEVALRALKGQSGALHVVYVSANSRGRSIFRA